MKRNEFSLSPANIFRRVCVGIFSPEEELQKIIAEGCRSARLKTRTGVCRTDRQNEPRGADTAQRFRDWFAQSYFIGSLELYIAIRRAFESAGLEYNESYYGTARDRRERNGLTPQEAERLFRISQANSARV